MVEGRYHFTQTPFFTLAVAGVMVVLKLTSFTNSCMLPSSRECSIQSKSTLLNIFGTLSRPSGGQLRLFDHDVLRMPQHRVPDLRLRRIGFVFQTFNLLAALSAFENVELPMVLLGNLSHSERKERTKQLLKEVGLEDRLEHLPSELSGGEQQRVAIARALANKPDLLLLDEPTGDLSSSDTCEIMDLLLEVNLLRNATCVMVTHNADLECYADRVLYLENGRFSRQRLNTHQRQLDASKYAAYLTSMEQNALDAEITPA